MHELLKERVIKPISDAELERRWKAVREVMQAKKVDFLLIENSADYLGGYIKWFTDLPAVHSYPLAAIFPVDDEMTTFSHGSSDPAEAGPAAWLLRGVKKRVSTPIMTSVNFTCSFDAEKIVEELKPYPGCRISFVNEGAIRAGFVNHIRQNMKSATFVDITDEIDLINPTEKRLYAHGQGYDLVERPCCQVGETMKIHENMTIAIHPPISKNGTANICDNYMVTRTGVSECLHETPQEIYVVK